MFIKSLSAVLASLMLFFSSLCVKISKPEIPSLPENTADRSEPRKYFTLSFDDGITQDYRIMEICRKYGFTGITFNINTGLCGESWDWVGEAIGSPETTHIRLAEKEIGNGAYEGFDVAAHTLTHPSMKDFDDRPLSVFKEVQRDALNIAKLTGVMPLGMAWPGGDGCYTEESIENVMNYTSIRFARGTTPTYGFSLPERFLKWEPTCSITDPRLFELAREFIDAEPEEDMLFYVWGHGYELDAFDKYGELEQLIKMMTENTSVVCVSNTEFYLLYKDVIPSA